MPMLQVAPEVVLSGTLWSIALIWMALKMAVLYFIEAADRTPSDAPRPLQKAA